MILAPEPRRSPWGLIGDSDFDGDTPGRGGGSWGWKVRGGYSMRFFFSEGEIFLRANLTNLQFGCLWLNYESCVLIK